MFKRLLLLAAIAATPLASVAQMRYTRSVDESFDKLSQFYNYLTVSYVDTVDTRSLVDGAIENMLGQLDPHSVYISAEEMKTINEQFEGSFEGIGIEFMVIRDTLSVVNVIKGGPSEKAGLMPNDRIVATDGKDAIGIKTSEVPGVLRGAKGTQIRLSILRKGMPPFDVTIVRDKIPMNSLDAAYKIDPTTGYIKLDRFSATTYDETLKAMNKLAPLNALVLDLRGNGGGYLDQAIKISNMFLDKNDLVVYTEGLNQPRQNSYASLNGRYNKLRLIVLVDEQAASASEIVAGAIQDHDRGLIVGRRTFGKGLVQRQFPLIDGSAVRITIARYHTPTGRVIQKPFEMGKGDEYNDELSERFRTGEISTGNGAAHNDSLKYYTLRSRRVVYGGGGISPDVFVPMDTTWFTTAWMKLSISSSLRDYAIIYVDRNRPQLVSQYPQFEVFEQGFKVTGQMIVELKQHAEEKGLQLDDAELAQSDLKIRVTLKALIAQKLWDTTEYMRVVNAEDDAIFQKAVEVLSDWERYSVGIESK